MKKKKNSNRQDVKSDVSAQPLCTVVHGNNNVLFEVVSPLYLTNGMRIADVTYGKGVFWKNVDTELYDFNASDIQTCPEAPYDFRDLPYEDDSFDVVVLDPPYIHNQGKKHISIVNRNYRNKETTGGCSHDDIIQLYRDGIAEAYRILQTGGLLWVKCKDEIENSIQRWSHIEILKVALELGFYAKDLLIHVPTSRTPRQFKNQKHVRKNHGYLWIFKKAKPGYRGLRLQREGMKI